MTSSEIVAEIISTANEAFIFLLPVIGIMAGINYVVSWVMWLTVKQGSRVFGR